MKRFFSILASLPVLACSSGEDGFLSDKTVCQPLPYNQTLDNNSYAQETPQFMYGTNGNQMRLAQRRTPFYRTINISAVSMRLSAPTGADGSLLVSLWKTKDIASLPASKNPTAEETATVSAAEVPVIADWVQIKLDGALSLEADDYLWIGLSPNYPHGAENRVAWSSYSGSGLNSYDLEAETWDSISAQGSVRIHECQ